MERGWEANTVPTPTERVDYRSRLSWSVDRRETGLSAPTTLNARWYTLDFHLMYIYSDQSNA